MSSIILWELLYARHSPGDAGNHENFLKGREEAFKQTILYLVRKEKATPYYICASLSIQVNHLIFILPDRNWGLKEVSGVRSRVCKAESQSWFALGTEVIREDLESWPVVGRWHHPVGHLHPPTALDTRLRIQGTALENLCYGPIFYSGAGKHPIPAALKQD